MSSLNKISSPDESSAISKPDVVAIMAEIRSRIKNSALQNQDEKIAFKPRQPDFSNSGRRKAGEIFHSEDRRFINLNFAYGSRFDGSQITTHRNNLIGKIIVGVKKRIFNFVKSFFSDYLKAEQDYNHHLINLLNETSSYIDDRDAAIFWDLSSKIDDEAKAVIKRFEQIHEEYLSANDSLRKELRTELSTIKSRFNQLDGVVKGIESIIANLAVPSPAVKPSAVTSSAVPTDSPAAKPAVKEDSKAQVDYKYLLFENRFRGSEFDISLKMQFYAGLFKEAKGPVLEIGAGRGELQKLFKERGINSYGVDLDQGMIQMAVKEGADVRYGDGIKHLRDLPDGSLGGIVAIQLVEHLEKEILIELIKLARAKVKTGGIVAFETINPKSVLALSSNYYRDITHVTPLHPDTLVYMMEMAGLKLREVQYLSPVADESRLSELPVVPDGPGRITDVVKILNYNIKQLNDLLYGFQDYCIICEAG